MLQACFTNRAGNSVSHAQQGWRGPSVSNPRIASAQGCSWAHTSTGFLVYMGTVGHTFPQDPCVHRATVGNMHLHSSGCSDPVKEQRKRKPGQGLMSWAQSMPVIFRIIIS